MQCTVCGLDNSDFVNQVNIQKIQSTCITTDLINHDTFIISDINVSIRVLHSNLLGCKTQG